MSQLASEWYRFIEGSSFGIKINQQTNKLSRTFEKYMPNGIESAGQPSCHVSLKKVSIFSKKSHQANQVTRSVAAWLKFENEINRMSKILSLHHAHHQNYSGLSIHHVA